MRDSIRSRKSGFWDSSKTVVGVGVGSGDRTRSERGSKEGSGRTRAVKGKTVVTGVPDDVIGGAVRELLGRGDVGEDVYRWSY